MDNWSQFLTFAQIAPSTAYCSAIHETPHYLMFGRMPTLPIDIIMGRPQSNFLIQHCSTRVKTSRNCSSSVKVARESRWTCCYWRSVQCRPTVPIVSVRWFSVSAPTTQCTRWSQQYIPQSWAWSTPSTPPFVPGRLSRSERRPVQWNFSTLRKKETIPPTQCFRRPWFEQINQMFLL